MTNWSILKFAADENIFLLDVRMTFYHFVLRKYIAIIEWAEKEDDV